MKCRLWYFRIVDVYIEMHFAVGLIFRIKRIVFLYAIQRSQVVVLVYRGILREVFHPSPHG